jgi:hypothetical protein
MLVVPAGDELKDRQFGLVTCGPAVPVDQLIFECGEEALGHGIGSNRQLQVMMTIGGGCGSHTRFTRYMITGSASSIAARVGTKIGCTSRTPMVACNPFLQSGPTSLPAIRSSS